MLLVVLYCCYTKVHVNRKYFLNPTLTLTPSLSVAEGMLEFNQAIAASNERLQVLEANHAQAVAEKDRLHALAIAGNPCIHPLPHINYLHICLVLMPCIN